MAAALPAPLLFAQRLADNDRGARHKALHRLKKYLRARTRGEAGGFTEDELIKIWKGLFYCMWMQDKPLLQEDLASTISQLLHCFLNTEGQLLFLRTFWQTMSREWNGLDRLRLDKFYLLERMLLRESFQVLKKNKWEDSFVDPFLSLLMKEVLHTDSQTPNGVKFHLIDIYLQELAKVGAAELRAEQNLKFIDPFCKIAAKTKDRHLMSTIARDVLGVILDQAPFAIEDLMKELKRSGGCIHGEGEEEEEEEEAAATAVHQKPRRQPCAESDDELFDEAGDPEEEEPVEDIGPVLQFDYSAVADRLFDLSSKKFTPPPNRKRLYTMVKRFRNLAEGKFPKDEFPEDVSTDEDDDEFSQKWARRKHFRALKLKEKEKKAKERADVEERLAAERTAPVHSKKRRKKRKTRADQGAVEDKSIIAPKHDEATVSGVTAAPAESTATHAANAETRGATSALGTDENSSSLLKLLTDSQGTKGPIKQKKTCLQEPVEAPRQNGLSVNEEPEGTVMRRSGKPKKLKRKLLQEAIESFVQAAPDDTAAGTGSPKKKLKRAQIGGKPGAVSAGVSRLKPAAEGDVLCKTDRHKKKPECSDVNANVLPPLATQDRAGLGLLPAKRVQVKAKKRKLLQSVEPGVAEKAAKKKSKGLNESLSGTHINGSPLLSSKKIKRSVLEQDIFVPLVTNPLKKSPKVDNDFVKFGKGTLPKPVFVRKSKSSVSGLISPKKFNLLLNSRMKKVTFGLSNNKTAEFKKTDKSILVSPDGAPRVAFNPEQKPLHGVLKTPLRRTSLGTMSKKKLKKRATLLSSPARAQATPFSPLTPKQPTAFSTPTRKPRMVTPTPSLKQSTALIPLHKKSAAFSTPMQRQSKKLSTPSQRQASAQKRPVNVSTPKQKRATALDFF